MSVAGDDGSAPALEATRDELVDQLVHAVRASQRATDTIDEVAGQILGLGRSDGRCLDIIDQHGRITAGALARESRLTTGAITGVIDRLERAGYVQRTADPNDRRHVLVELTPAARAASWELFGPLAESTAPLLARYSDDELRLLIGFHHLGREAQERHVEHLQGVLRARRDGG